MNTKCLLRMLAVAMSVFTAPTFANTLMTWGGGELIGTANESGWGNTFSTTDSRVNISSDFYNGGAYLTFRFVGTNFTNLGGGHYSEDLSGNFDIRTGMGGSGSLLLGGSFTSDAGVLFEYRSTFGVLAGTEGILSEDLTFTSQIIDGSLLGVERAVSFSFSGVSGLTFGSHQFSNFVASAGSGNASADPMVIPEPDAICLTGLGLVGVALSRFWH